MTTLAPIGPSLGWSRSSAKPVQPTSSHQLTSRKAATAPTTTVTSMTSGLPRPRAIGLLVVAIGGRGDGGQRQAEERDGVPDGVDAEVEDASAQLADAGAPIGQRRGDEGAAASENADNRTNGATPGRSRSMSPMPVLARSGSAKTAAPMR